MSNDRHEDELPERWTPKQREFFLRVYRHMLRCQRAFVHPAAPAVDPGHWTTTAWNAAYFATHCVADDSPFIVHADEEGEVFAAEVPKDALQ